MKNIQLMTILRRKRITWITPCKRSAARGQSISTPLQRRCLTWITPCKRSTARGSCYPIEHPPCPPSKGELYLSDLVKI